MSSSTTYHCTCSTAPATAAAADTAAAATSSRQHVQQPQALKKRADIIVSHCAQIIRLRKTWNTMTQPPCNSSARRRGRRRRKTTVTHRQPVPTPTTTKTLRLSPTYSLPYDAASGLQLLQHNQKHPRGPAKLSIARHLTLPIAAQRVFMGFSHCGRYLWAYRQQSIAQGEPSREEHQETQELHTPQTQTLAVYYLECWFVSLVAMSLIATHVLFGGRPFRKTDGISFCLQGRLHLALVQPARDLICVCGKRYVPPLPAPSRSEGCVHGAGQTEKVFFTALQLQTARRTKDTRPGSLVLLANMCLSIWSAKRTFSNEVPRFVLHQMIPWNACSAQKRWLSIWSLGDSIGCVWIPATSDIRYTSSSVRKHLTAAVKNEGGLFQEWLPGEALPPWLEHLQEHNNHEKQQRYTAGNSSEQQQGLCSMSFDSETLVCTLLQGLELPLIDYTQHIVNSLTLHHRSVGVFFICQTKVLESDVSRAEQNGLLVHGSVESAIMRARRGGQIHYRHIVCIGWIAVLDFCAKSYHVDEGIMWVAGDHPSSFFGDFNPPIRPDAQAICLTNWGVLHNHSIPYFDHPLLPMRLIP